MMREIGSNFWENVYLETENNLELISNKLINKEIYYFKSGRNAIKYLSDILYLKGNKVLLPAYTCSTVVDPFLENNWKISYIDVDENLKIDEKLLLKKIDIEKPNVILFHSYFGFDTSSNIYTVLEFAQKQGIIIIEDLTQSLFSNFDKFEADYYVSSLRKFFCIVDGGFIISKNKLHINYEDYDKVLEHISLEAFELKNKYMNELLEDKKCFRNLYTQANKRFAMNDSISMISPSSLSILEKIDFSYIKYKRIENFKFLSNKFSQIKCDFVIPFTELKSNEVPLYFVLIFKDKKLRNSIQKFMASKNIFCPIIWPKPKNIENIKLICSNIYDGILCIPCDQRYSIKDMEYIVECFKMGVSNI